MELFASTTNKSNFGILITELAICVYSNLHLIEKMQATVRNIDPFIKLYAYF